MRIVDTAYDKNGNKVSLSKFVDDYLNHNPKRAKWKFEKVKLNIRNLTTKTALELAFKEFLEQDFDKIIKASPDKLESYIAKVNKSFPGLLFDSLLNKQTHFGALVESAFEYESFRKSSKARWFANSLSIKTCLYCNSQFTLIVRKNNSIGLLFQFDHFFSKSKHPYLSLSMYNLIPSCSNCNISKSKSDFNLSNSVHPYIEDFNTLMSFNVSNSDVLDYLINLKKSNKISVILKHFNLKVQKHIDTFSLNEIFNEHTDFVEEIFLKAYYYNPSKIRELTNEFSGLINKETIKRFILGNYYLDSDLNKRPLAKMIKDISLQVKLIDKI